MGTFNGIRKQKRKVKAIPIFPRKADFIKDLVAEIERIKWPYAKDSIRLKADSPVPILPTFHRREQLQSRDQGLAALLSLLGPRISEALRFQRKHFTDEDDRISVADFTPGKNGDIRTGLWLPKLGKLAPLTEVFYKWFVQVPDDSEAYVFPTAKPFGVIRWNTPLERARAHWIFNSTIKKFPHWYRGVTETYVGKVVFRNDPFKLKTFMGVRRIESVYPYIGEPWAQDLENFSQE